MYSPETVSRIEYLRAVAQTRKLTQEEQTEALSLIRADRSNASYASAGARAKKATAAAKPDGADILAKLQAFLPGASS